MPSAYADESRSLAPPGQQPPCTLFSGAAVRPSGLSADSVEGLDGHLDDNNNNKDNGEKHSITPGKNRDQEDAPSANGSDDLAFLPGIRPLRAKPKTGVTGSESASANIPIAQSRMTASRYVDGASTSGRA